MSNEHKQRMDLFINYTLEQGKADVSTNYTPLQRHVENGMGILAYQREASGMRRYRIPAHLIFKEGFFLAMNNFDLDECW